MRLKSYRVIPSALGAADIAERCKKSCSGLGSTDRMTPTYEYDRLLQYLACDCRADVRPLSDLMAPVLCGTNRYRLVIRHDIDHDIMTAVALSEMESDYLMSASYYIHHASFHYYGDIDKDKTFRRHDCLAEAYLHLQKNGGEVGLHVDAFSLYRRGINGLQAIETELSWLRSIGLNIKGVTGHGSAQYCGAENFEIFEEFLVSGKELITLNSVCVYLGSLSAAGLGLFYEGNFAKRRNDIKKEKLASYLNIPNTEDLESHLEQYLHKNPMIVWGQDFTIWLHGRNYWTIAATDGNGIFRYGVGLDDVLAFLKNVEDGSRVVLHIHPCYYGYRG